MFIHIKISRSVPEKTKYKLKPIHIQTNRKRKKNLNGKLYKRNKR